MSNGPPVVASSEERHTDKVSRPPTAPPLSQEVPPKPRRQGVFSRKKNQTDLLNEKAIDSSLSDAGPATREKKAIPIDPDTGKPYTPINFFQLFRYSTPFEIIIDIVGLVCAAASGSSQPLMSLLFGRLSLSFVSFATIVLEKDYAKLPDAAKAFRRDAAKDAGYLAILGIGMFAVTYIYMLIWTYTGELNARRIREKYLKAVLRQDIAFFDKLGAGEVATRIQTDTHMVQRGISEKVALIISHLGAFVAGFALGYARSWKLALALTSMVPFMVITGALLQIFEAKYKKLAIDQIAIGGTFAEEVISTVRTAQAFGTQQRLSDLYNEFVSVAYKAELRSAVVHGVGLGAFFFCIYASYALAFYFGTTLILSGEANAGTIVNVFFSIFIGTFSLALLAPEQQAVAVAQAAAAKLFATIDRVPPIDSASTAGRRLDTVVGNITFEDVIFHYPSRPDAPVLKSLTVDFAAGKTAALVGASGAGKSTVVALVERFYDPVQGTIRLDGIDIRNLNLNWLRQQIGFVEQEPSLFSETIRRNVAHGLIGSRFENIPEVEKEQRIKEACIMANADSFIQTFPDGYDTLVGERGFLISGGQKQRIAIARAIVSDPRILLLDEATSALDTQSEGVVQDALDKAAAGRTTITIAHRLSTIRDAEQIYVMASGSVLEHGTHNELLREENGAYAQLVSAQRLKGSVGGDDGPVAGRHMNTGDFNGVIKDVQLMDLEGLNVRGSATTNITGKQRGSQFSKFHDKEYGILYLFKRMGRLDREDLWANVGGSIAAIVTGLIYPGFGIIFSKALNAWSVPDRHQIRVAGDRNALWMFIVAIVATIAMALQTSLFSRAAAGLTKNLRTASFRAMLRQDISWFDEEHNSTGRLISVLSDNPSKISAFAGMSLGAIVQNIATVLAGAIAALCFGPKLAAVGIACIPIVISAGAIGLRIVVLKDQTNKKFYADSAQLACEAAGSVRTVQSLTREDECNHEYSLSLEGPFRKSTRTALWSSALFALSGAMSFFVIALVFYYGSTLVASLEYTTFQFFACLMTVTLGSIQAGSVFGFIPDISAAKSAANDIVNLLDQVPLIDAESAEGTTVDTKTCQGEIRLEDVHFHYPTRPGVPVLRGLSLSVEPGTYVALVGASGCGKSTTIQLIERFYDPQAGRITLDQMDISTANIQDYRRQLALVSQEPALYAGTIKFNILLGATKPEGEVTQEELEQACRDANILEFIETLPQGFDTEVGGKGAQLSGGQKQRVAIARALLRNPKVLLLDEATSALDSQSEKVVQAALDNAAKGRTTIAIAHRLSTIQNADKIYYIKEGRVAESGTHDELLALKGGYYELVQLQALTAT